MEEVFSFARLGVHASNYWLWPGDPYDWTKQPVYKAYEGLRDHMGDTILSVYSDNDTAFHVSRLGITRSICGALTSRTRMMSRFNSPLANLPHSGYSA